MSEDQIDDRVLGAASQRTDTQGLGGVTRADRHFEKLIIRVANDANEVTVTRLAKAWMTRAQRRDVDEVTRIQNLLSVAFARFHETEAKWLIAGILEATRTFRYSIVKEESIDELLKHVQSPKKRQWMFYLDGKESSTPKEMAKEFGVTPSAVTHGFKQLVDAELVDVQNSGRNRLYSLTKLGKQCVQYLRDDEAKMIAGIEGLREVKAFVEELGRTNESSFAFQDLLDVHEGFANVIRSQMGLQEFSQVVAYEFYLIAERVIQAWQESGELPRVSQPS